MDPFCSESQPSRCLFGLWVNAAVGLPESERRSAAHGWFDLGPVPVPHLKPPVSSLGAAQHGCNSANNTLGELPKRISESSDKVCEL